jgi:polyhydroxybutyrate depolymerase
MRTTFLAVMMAGTLAGAARAQITPVHDTVTADKVVREFYVVLPPHFDSTHAAPLAFFFHGGGGNALGALKNYRFADVAGAGGAVVVYPEGLSHHWNDDRNFFPGPSDYAFILKMLERLSLRMRLDHRRIFAVGHSNGGMMSNSAACHLPGIFAAIGSMGGPLPRNGLVNCRTTRPVSVIEIQGVADPVVPYAGGTITGSRGDVLGADSTVAIWAAIDGCAAAPTRTPLAPVDQSDPTRVTKIEFRSCSHGRSVVLYAIEGGGHPWPGGESDQLESIVGPKTNQMDATKVIWEFFAAHPSP